MKTPIDFRLVALVVAGAAVAIIGYGLLTGGDPLPENVTDPVIVGAALPEYDDDPLGDTAIGRQVPVATGTNLAGDAVVLGPTGTPQIVVFLAHWCSHCRDEVPAVQAWLDAGNLPAGVDFVSVVTAIDSGADNYPPDAWLQREAWSPTVLADTTSDVARAYGLSGFPYWVFIDADGAVAGRTSGEVPVEQLAVVANALVG